MGLNGSNANAETSKLLSLLTRERLDLFDHQRARTTSQKKSPFNLNSLSRKWKQLFVLARSRRVISNRQINGSVIAQNNQRRTGFSAGRSALRTNGFLQFLRKRACGIDHVSLYRNRPGCTRRGESNHEQNASKRRSVP